MEYNNIIMSTMESGREKSDAIKDLPSTTFTKTNLSLLGHPGKLWRTTKIQNVHDDEMTDVRVRYFCAVSLSRMPSFSEMVSRLKARAYSIGT